MKLSSFLLSILLLGTSVLMFSCNDDDDSDDPVGTPEGVSANRVEIFLVRRNDTTDKQTYVFSDPDGLGGNAPVTNDTIRLIRDRSYNMTTRFFNGNNDVTSEIRDNGTKYIVCYSSSNSGIGLRISDLDSIASLPLGLSGSLIAQSSIIKGSFNVLLKYQPQTKDGLCGPGTRVIEANMNYDIR